MSEDATSFFILLRMYAKSGKLCFSNLFLSLLSCSQCFLSIWYCYWRIDKPFFFFFDALSRLNRWGCYSFFVLLRMPSLESCVSLIFFFLYCLVHTVFYQFGNACWRIYLLFFHCSTFKVKGKEMNYLDFLPCSFEVPAERHSQSVRLCLCQ